MYVLVLAAKVRQVGKDAQRGCTCLLITQGYYSCIGILLYPALGWRTAFKLGYYARLACLKNPSHGCHWVALVYEFLYLAVYVVFGIYSLKAFEVDALAGYYLFKYIHN